MNRAALDALIAIHAEGNFTRAANKLNLSQPALSRRISGLEEQLGITLVERQGGKATLTDAGRTLLPHAESALASLRDATDSINALKTGKSGAIVLAFADQLCRSDLLEALALFIEEFQDVDLSLRTGNSASVSNAVRRGDAMLGLRYRADPDPRLAATIVRTETAMVICSPRHPLSLHPSVTPDDLAGETWIGIPTAPHEPDGGLKRTLAEYGLRASRTMPINDAAAQKKLVEAGFGLGIVSGDSVRNELANGRLAALRVAGMNAEVPVAMVSRRGGFVSKPAQRLMDLLRRTMGGAQAAAPAG